LEPTVALANTTRIVAAAELWVFSQIAEARTVDVLPLGY
jgi:hypothetical protein